MFSACVACNSSSRNSTNAYTYDAASNRTGFTDPENGSTTYAYDTLNRLTSLAPPSAFGSGSFGFSYDALSRRTQMTRPNSVTTNYTFDNLWHITSVAHQLSGIAIDGASYTLDSAGNRTAKTDQLAGVTSNYTYDAIYQLTQVTQANNTTEGYSYDAVGNRTASLGVSSYTTNASNELTAMSNATYTYDSNGNTLTKADSTGTRSRWQQCPSRRGSFPNVAIVVACRQKDQAAVVNFVAAKAPDFNKVQQTSTSEP